MRVLGGDRTRIAVDFARAIHEATAGEVPWWAWTTDGASPAVGPESGDLTVVRGPEFDQRATGTEGA